MNCKIIKSVRSEASLTARGGFSLIRCFNRVAILFILAGPAPATADYLDGLAAYVKGDNQAACREFESLAASGNEKAQLKLGEMHSKGECGKGAEDAVKWFTMAAEHGNAEAQINLGLLHFNGKGVLQSDAEAARWYRKAADQGNSAGQWMIGALYADGKGVSANNAEAVNWYRRSADQGNAIGQRLLGEMYEKGRGVAQNYVQAYMWLTLALENGDVVAADIRYAFANKMTQDQISEAKKLASQWRPKKKGGSK